jgi:hypothetical protein
MTRAEHQQFERMVSNLPGPVGPFLVPVSSGEMVRVACDPFRMGPRPSWARRHRSALLLTLAVVLLLTAHLVR